MKKINFYFLMGISLGVLTLPLEGATNPQTPANTQASTKSAHHPATNSTAADEEDEEYEILDRDQIENTDTLAIPLDDSEVEDEEEVNRAEKKEVFNLPHSR
jgi:hypothetical protein